MKRSIFAGMSLLLIVGLLNSPVYAFTKLSVMRDQVVIISSSVLGEDEGKQEEKKEEKKEEEKEEEKRVEVKQEEKKEEVKRVEVKREEVRVKVSPGETSKVEIYKKNKAVEMAKQAIEKKREELKTKLESGATDGEVTEKERELLKTELDKQGEKLLRLQEKPEKTLEDKSVGVDMGTQQVRSSDGKTEFNDEGANVSTTLPLTIEPESEKVEVETPNNEVVEMDRPRKILEKLREQNELENLSFDAEASPTSTIEMSGESPIYDLHGTKSEKMFGFLPVKIEKNLQVDVNGKVINTRQSFISSFLDFLSI